MSVVRLLILWRRRPRVVAIQKNVRLWVGTMLTSLSVMLSKLNALWSRFNVHTNNRREFHVASWQRQLQLTFCRTDRDLRVLLINNLDGMQMAVGLVAHLMNTKIFTPYSSVKELFDGCMVMSGSIDTVFCLWQDSKFNVRLRRLHAHSTCAQSQICRGFWDLNPSHYYDAHKHLYLRTARRVDSNPLPVWARYGRKCPFPGSGNPNRP